MTHDQLESYINNFGPNQREHVYKQIIDAELLRKAFESSEGKNILNSAVDLIAQNVMNIVRNCEGAGNDEVLKSAQIINTTYKLMSDWARILIEGGVHREKAEKIN
jgi:hypothetical protein